MDFDSIFNAMYTLYRAESSLPASTDDEYVIALRLANEAVARWANYDNTYWKELFDTLQNSGDGDSVIVSGTTAYACPDDFKEGGGYIKILDANNNTVRRYPVLEPQEVQFKKDQSTLAYFTGNPADGYVLNLSPTPDTAILGLKIDYVYYKTPTTFTQGSDITEMSNPYFIVHRVLAQRFRASRNPFYNSALRDAEDALKIMQMENNSGSWSNPWQVADNSGTQWGR